MIEIKDDSILLSDGSNQYDLPFLWLRDNCQCDECRITETQEKQFLLHSVPVDIAPKHVEEIGNNINIIWPDDHKTFIPIDLIKKLHLPRYPKHSSWPNEFEPEKYNWSEFLAVSYTHLTLPTIYSV